MPLNVLVCIDEHLTETSKEAAEYVVKNIAKDGDHVTGFVVCVNPYNPPANHWDFSGGKSDQAHNPDGAARAKETIKVYISELAAAAGKSIEASGMSAWEQSNPENAILEAVKSAKPDLLVLGHTGQKSIVEKMLSHSVAKYLVDNAPCPVLVVKAKWDV